MSNVDIDTAREYGIDLSDPAAALERLEAVAGEALEFEGYGCTGGECRHCAAAAVRHLHGSLMMALAAR